MPMFQTGIATIGEIAPKIFEHGSFLLLRKQNTVQAKGYQGSTRSNLQSNVLAQEKDSKKLCHDR